MCTVMCIGMFWIFLWLQYSSNFLVMCAASTYYFNSDTEAEGTAELLLALKFCHVK